MPNQGAFRRDVREHMCPRRIPESVRHDEDDTSEASAPHARNERLGQEQRGLDVHRLDPAPRPEPQFIERFDADHRGRVNQRVAPAISLKDRVGCPAHVVRVGEVDDDIARPIQHDHGVVWGEPIDDRPANGARAARHHGHPARRVNTHVDGRGRASSDAGRPPGRSSRRTWCP